MLIDTKLLLVEQEGKESETKWSKGMYFAIHTHLQDFVCIRLIENPKATLFDKMNQIYMFLTLIISCNRREDYFF